MKSCTASRITNSCAEIPVLVFSWSESDADIHTAYDNHANGYIIKPESVAHLPKATRKVPNKTGDCAQVKAGQFRSFETLKVEYSSKWCP